MEKYLELTERLVGSIVVVVTICEIKISDYALTLRKALPVCAVPSVPVTEEGSKVSCSLLLLLRYQLCR